LGLERIDTLLLHSFRSFERYSEVLLPVLDHYCSRGLIGEYGLSVYHPFEIETAIEKTRQAGFRIAALQFPVNIFDQRFLKGGYLPKLQSSAITLYGRSIFLQGLFFMDAASLGGHLNLAKPKLRQLADLAEIHCTSVEALAILFALSSGIDYIVLGVDSAAQLEKNAALISKDTSSLSPALRRVFDMLEVSDEEIILPYRWKEWTWETTGLMTQKIGVT
jgi:aryl-alcohol dehydrogenase-like predicted oxidoreductase